MKRLVLASIAVFLVFTLIGCEQQNEAASGDAANLANNEESSLVQEESQLEQVLQEQQREESTNCLEGQETTSSRRQEETTKKQQERTNGHIYVDGLSISVIPDKLEFKSIEQFLEAYKTVKEGKAVGDLANKADSVDFTGLEKLYVPKNIPEEYQLANILVNEDAIILWYLPKEHMGSSDAIQMALAKQMEFQIGFARWDLDDPMAGIMKQKKATEKDLIDGKYLFSRPNMLQWELDRGVMNMYMPLKYCTSKKKIAEAVKFAEVTAIDLTR